MVLGVGSARFIALRAFLHRPSVVALQLLCCICLSGCDGAPPQLVVCLAEVVPAQQQDTQLSLAHCATRIREGPHYTGDATSVPCSLTLHACCLSLAGKWSTNAGLSCNSSLTRAWTLLAQPRTALWDL